MKKKGISPIIAFVLVITLVISLGAFVSVWYKNTSTKQIESALKQLENTADCKDVKFEIGFDYETCSISVFNVGDQLINKLGISYSFANGTRLSEIKELSISPNARKIIEQVPDFAKVVFTPVLIRSGKEITCTDEREFSLKSPFDCSGEANCGDGICSIGLGENKNNCPVDCYCGDGLCNAADGENKDLCPEDCVICGDGVCDSDYDEDCLSCTADCACKALEKCDSKTLTCLNSCGDSVCSPEYGEDCNTCVSDCGCLDLQKCEAGSCVNSCPDGTCSPDFGESCNTCLDDCSCAKGQSCSKKYDQCVFCESKKDCSSPTPYCDLNNFKCVQCLSDSNCNFPLPPICCLGKCQSGPCIAK